MTHPHHLMGRCAECDLRHALTYPMDTVQWWHHRGAIKAAAWEAYHHLWRNGSIDTNNHASDDELLPEVAELVRLVRD